MGITVASPTWRVALPALVIALSAIVALYGSTVAGMALQWWYYQTYAHGMLVVPIILYMVWVRRQAIARLEPCIAPVALGGLLLLSLGWLVAEAAQVAVVQHFTVVGIIQVTVYALLGKRVAWAIAFPLAYLLFAAPIGEALIPPLQQVTAWFTVEGLRLTGIPVLWEGLYIIIPTGTFEVAAACSGLRYLIASVALGALYAYLTYHSVGRRLAFIALSVVMPIIANGVRAYGIVMIAHVSGMKYATGVDHLIYGWLFFGLVALLMFWIGSFWREPAVANQESAIEDQPVVNPVGMPVMLSTAERYAVWTLAVILVAAIGPAWAKWTLQESRAVAPVVLPSPPAVAPWQGPEADTDTWEPQFSAADAVVRSRYALEGQTVHLYIAYYRQQRPDAKLVSSQNSLYDRQHWRYISTADAVRIPVAGRDWPLQATLLADGQRRKLVWSGYWEGGQRVVSPYVAKLWESWDRLSGAQRGSALVAVAADYKIQPDEVKGLLQRFMEATGPGIDAELAQIARPSDRSPASGRRE